MRITDLPSLGPHARSHNIRKDVAQVLSQIGMSAQRGADPSMHIKAFKEFLGACARELKTIERIVPSALVSSAEAPKQLELSLDNI
jgi:hypothetical protein